MYYYIIHTFQAEKPLKILALQFPYRKLQTLASSNLILE